MFARGQLIIIAEALQEKMENGTHYLEQTYRLYKRCREHLDYLCPKCEGTGVWEKTRFESKKCPDCEGRGVAEEWVNEDGTVIPKQFFA